MNRLRKKYDTDYKKRIVEEFIKGDLSAQELTDREGIPSTGHIYKWKCQFEKQTKVERIDALVEEGSSVEAAKRILELEEELADAKQLIAAYAMANEFLKKIQTPSEKKSSGYIETKRAWGRSKWRAK